MKRKGNIYCEIIKPENIKTAIMHASIGKKKRVNVQKVLNNLEKNVFEIQKMLINNTYIPSPYEQKIIHDGARKKERVIFKPRFYPDQIIHWCLMEQLQSVLEKGMYDYCCASVKNRGIIYGVKHIKKILKSDKKNTKYCLKLDIKKFYPSIDKEILKRKFRKVLKDRETLNLIDKIIDSSDQGLPIGNYTSQWFANFFLQDLDHYIKEKMKVKYYIRYMDDMILFSKNKRELHKIKDNINIYLNNENLKLKENWQLFKTDSRPLDFIGYRFYRDYTTLRSSNFLRIKRRIKKISKKFTINYNDAAAVISYYGWIKHCNSYNFTQKHIKPYVNLKKCKGVIKYASGRKFKSR